MKKPRPETAEIIKRKGKPLIVLLGLPVLFSLLFSACFGEVYVDDIPIAVCDMDGGSQAVSEMVEQLEAGGGLTVTMETNSAAEMKEAMLLGEVQAAVVFPEGFGSDFRSGKSVEAMYLVNGTNFMISNNALLYGTNAFTAVNKELRVKLLENGNIVPYTAEQMSGTLAFTDRILFNPQMSYLQFIVLGLLAIIIQQTYLTMLSALLVYTKEGVLLTPPDSAEAARIQRKSLCVNLLKNAAVYASCSAVGLIGALLALHQWFAVPMNANIGKVLLLLFLFLLDIAAASLVVGSLFRDEAHCVQFDMFLAIPTFLTCGFAWPEFMMPPLFASAVKAIWPLYYFAAPLRDLLLKGTNMSMLTEYINGSLLFAAFWLPVGAWLYMRSLKKCQTGKIVSERMLNP